MRSYSMTIENGREFDSNVSNRQQHSEIARTLAAAPSPLEEFGDCELSVARWGQKVQSRDNAA